jgi:predicted RNase H-like HicB family nuclease
MAFLYSPAGSAGYWVRCEPILVFGRAGPQTQPMETSMQFEFTAVFREAPEGGYVAFVEELPGANTQGETLEAARANLRDAVELVIEANRAIAIEDLGDAEVIREPLRLTA